MRRLFCLVVLSLGLAQHAVAQQNVDNETISSYLTQKFGVAKEKAMQIANAVNLAAERYSLPPAVLLAIISTESRFREKARGANGATGLMQVVPSAHRGLIRDIKDLTDPDANINAGSAILFGYMQSAGGDLNAAMKSYGGSRKYAEKIQLRAQEFDQALSAPKGDTQQDASAAGAAGAASAAALAVGAAASSVAANASAPTGN